MVVKDDPKKGMPKWQDRSWINATLDFTGSMKLHGEGNSFPPRVLQGRQGPECDNSAITLRV